MESWKKVKISGTYYRNIKKNKEKIFRRAEEIRDEIRRNRVVHQHLISVPSTVVNIRQTPQQISICNDPIYHQPSPLNLSAATIPSGVCDVHIYVYLYTILYIQTYFHW